MVFGRKEKHPAVPEPEDLNLVYGINEEEDDESSVGSSVPPPPPNGQDMYGSYHDQPFKDEPTDLDEEHAASIEAPDVGISMFAEPTDYGSSRDPSRRKKSLVILGCILTFCALLGVAVAYGRKASGATQSSSSAAEVGTDMTAPSNSTNINGTNVGRNNSTESEHTFNSTKIPDNETATETPVNETTTESPLVETETPAVEDNATASPNVSPSDLSTHEPTDLGTDEPTSAPADIGTDEPTSSPNDFGTDEPTDIGTDEPTSAPADDADTSCVRNQVKASASCKGGTTSANVSICTPRVVSDEFWAWVSTPDAYQSFADNEWDWIPSSGSTSVVVDNLPEGSYTIGLFGSGKQRLDEYPLLASTDFNIVCN